MIYTDDHAPAHVHVAGKGGLVIFTLDEANRTVSIREAYDVSKRDARLIALIQGILGSKRWMEQQAA